MKKRCIKLAERLRHVWRSLLRKTSRNHDPFLVYSMTSFNFGGGWRELRLKASPKYMPAKSTIALINEPFGI
jgi:hypothetical protein